MTNFIQKITNWMLEKEEELAKSCSVPMQEIEYQINKVEAQKEKLQSEYESTMAELNEVLDRLNKIKNIEVLRCQEEKKES